MPTERAPRATPALTAPSETFAEKIAAAPIHIQAMKDSDEWPKAPNVQEAAAAWGDVNGELAAQHRKVLDLEKELDIERAHEAVLGRRWNKGANRVLSSVSSHCDGSTDKVKRMGFGVRAWTPRAPYETPEGLLGKRGKPRTATAKWLTHRGDQRNFHVQHATSPEDPATHSNPRVVSGGTFVLEDQTPGATIHFRVRAIDAKLPSGYTDWTAWVAVMVSA